VQRYKIKIIQRNNLPFFVKIQRNKLLLFVKIQRNNDYSKKVMILQVIFLLNTGEVFKYSYSFSLFLFPAIAQE